ncbi:uncharacterized protein KY384_002704 [Bacidia gigantensis]|uniref:uncharacterized protein n=1 Tax=Bacidia gigantensis TaxID=2732470 RepID=UPI001D04FB57|nr:uncharacterized protein KY384_002704 [Bacidia gigantensis]KAG8532826.1 hypothetical protein KY384_002704 [Bacidia gigantensis]
MTHSLSSVALAGSTGLVGSQVLSTLLSLPSAPTVHALTRRELPHSFTSSSLQPILEKESASWPQRLSSLSPPPTAYITALGTTRAAAGSVAAQRSIDLDLNLSLAKAAKESGVNTFVLLSSAGTSSKSYLAYSKMKGELEDAVKELGFAHCVIVRPGLLVGQREDTRVAEAVLRSLANGMGKLTGGWGKDFWAQDADVIARAIVRAAEKCVDGQQAEGVWVVEQKDVVRLGRTEWDEGGK